MPYLSNLLLVWLSSSGLVLALDEVWDPQNFGALLRSSYFLGIDKVVVCAKNSAPLSPTVSKASAGAMEAMDVFSTRNMMKFLDKAKNNGWAVWTYI
jgi:21S rRNA (GM2251-2'-O)-methyltransferase